MSELDDLERDLRAAADTWFADRIYAKLNRLIEIAREKTLLAERLEKLLQAIETAQEQSSGTF